MDICARKGCDKEYERKTHNQKYCDDECCRLATNERLMVKYYKDRDRMAGAVRICTACEDTRLSRYNSNDKCSACEQKQEAQRNNAVVNMLSIVSTT